MDPRRGLVVGETLVDLFPVGSGALADVDGFRYRPGGAPANVAVGLSRLDAAPQLWTRLGDDQFGTYLAEHLAGHDVPDRYIVRDDGSDTMLAFVVPGEDDQSFAFYQADPALAFERARIPDDALEDLAWLHFGGVALSHPTGRTSVLATAKRARECDATVTFDPNTRMDLFDAPGDAADALEAALAATDVLCCSPDDLVPLDVAPRQARDDPRAVATELLDRGPHTVFLTLGDRGAAVVTDATPASERIARDVDAFAVETVDTTGAGDAFTAAVLSRFQPGWMPDRVEHVLRFAAATAGLVTTETGATGSFPDADEVDSFLDGRL
jgi:fructokinase